MSLIGTSWGENICKGPEASENRAYLGTLTKVKYSQVYMHVYSGVRVGHSRMNRDKARQQGGSGHRHVKKLRPYPGICTKLLKVVFLGE